MSRSAFLTWASRALVALVVLVASVIAGQQLRDAREGAAARAGSPAPSASSISRPTIFASLPPTVIPTMHAGSPTPYPPTPQATTTPASQPTKFFQSLPTPSPQPTPGPASTIAGRVTANGIPVSGADIRVYKADASANGPTPVPPEAGTAITAADGTYRVAVPAGIYRVGAYVDEQSALAKGFHWVTWSPSAYAIGLAKDIAIAGSTGGVDIAMLRSVTVSGRVVGRDGVGIPNATVSTGRFFNVGYPIAGGQTDATGAFTFHTVAMDVTFSVAAQGKTGGVSTARDIDVKGDVSGLVFTLDRGHIISGVLRDTSGRPLAKAQFRVTSTDGSMACWCFGSTDESGHYALVVASGALRFQTTPMYPGEPVYVSKDYTVIADMALDVVLAKQ